MKQLLGLVDAEGVLSVDKFSESSLSNLYTIDCSPHSSSLALSLDWSNLRCDTDPQIAVSMSDGRAISVNTSTQQLVHDWQAHDYETWIAAWDHYSPNHILYTGADDCVFKAWDLRVGLNAPVSSNKKFDGGVTTISNSPHNQNELAVGSYDETLRIFDKRNLKTPTSSIKTSGGIWRIKYHETDDSKLVMANMYGGFDVVDLHSSAIVHTNTHHNLAYGVDWNKEGLIMSASFYDRKDNFSEQHIIKPDAALDKCMQNAANNGLPDISVSAIQGKFLMIQAKMMRAKRVLEIGTLAGYSSIWLSKALPADGELISLESNEKFAQLSRENIAYANPSCRVEVKHGAALETLDTLQGAFDMVFIDADKMNSAAYLRKAVDLTRPGAVIYVDNTVRNYNILLDEHTQDPYGIGIRAVYPALQQLQDQGLIEATNIQICSSKGHDGLAIAPHRNASKLSLHYPQYLPIQMSIYEQVDKYAERFLIGEDDGLGHAIENCTQNGLPPIRVSAMQGKFIMMQAKLIGARRILEVGTLGGYSTIWLARALSHNGELISCECSSAFAQVARSNVEYAKVAPKVDIRVGAALETISRLDDIPFDFVFIDADKSNSPNYLAESVKRTRKGAMIVIDNTIQDARSFLDPNNMTPNVLGNRQVYKLLQEYEARGELIATHQQIANEKGTDAFVLAVRV
ncbi:hypothetical protein E3P77_01172 [Wallemia ichthyophaga]|uniref:Uncharacterized protein n=1 Tax=Wallemia ichthyophaga TaxID=245174 RepID=A0A4T0EGX2_WALIC|nr:hypothetical protein E3P91_01500 [Wallemia ichthyophaga]TIA81488.1 hypothetical protein E3P98_02030 [Wallemia ichthyophaga]TIB12032.1 hypothetical protein E3P90_02188 [Wallemia ichthyophaga]TIB13358.1 hypothetical protein E3P93_02025 [Wallemia ichthyophaga]TIB22990.1 hypothetical protein E3P89_01796 [Wallemia ichthyophaga]